MQAEWQWIWQYPDSAGDQARLIYGNDDQTGLLGALLSDLLSSAARLTGIIPYGIACDVLTPLELGKTVNIHLSQERVAASELPQSLWLTYRACSEGSVTPAVVGLIRGGLLRRW